MENDLPGINKETITIYLEEDWYKFPPFIHEEVIVTPEEFEMIEKEVFPPMRNIDDFKGQFGDMVVFGAVNVKNGK